MEARRGLQRLGVLSGSITCGLRCRASQPSHTSMDAASPSPPSRRPAPRPHSREHQALHCCCPGLDPALYSRVQQAAVAAIPAGLARFGARRCCRLLQQQGWEGEVLPLLNEVDVQRLHREARNGLIQLCMVAC